MPVFIGVIVVIAFLGLGWLAQGSNFFMYQLFAPKYEQVRRETFEQSKAYRQGQVQELQSLQLDYVKGDAATKQAIGSVVIQRTADLDLNAMPPAIQQFVNQVRADKGINQ